MADDAPGRRKYDLEERTLAFALRVRALARRLPRTVCNAEDVRQLAKASGSVGANYIEANEGLGKKDFVMRLKIARKEAKESRFFLRAVFTGDSGELNVERDALVQEATELVLILTAIIGKFE